MTNRERFDAALHFRAADRCPVYEWAAWWDKTVERWRGEGVPDGIDINAFFGQDAVRQFHLPIRLPGCPAAPGEGMGIMETPEDYEKLKAYLYGDQLIGETDAMLAAFAADDAQRDTAVWFSIEGFFWFPRTLFGIENHFYAFYDYPDLLLEINRDLCAYYKRLLPAVFRHLRPAYMTFAEDMSYNHGPMLSKEQFDTFLLPFYRELVPLIQAQGTRVFIDTDGFVEPLIPWFREAGIEGVLPLERMAGVDVCRIRETYPDFLMIGGFDKTVMHNGEAAMRTEFERILPAIRAGGYIPSVDHQTPPDVSVENYRIFMRLLREYSTQYGADLKK